MSACYSKQKMPFNVHWGSEDGPSIRDIREELANDKGGRWSFGIRFSMMHAAKEWHLLPSQFFVCSESDKAYMMEYDSEANDMAAWEDHIASEKARKEKNRI